MEKEFRKFLDKNFGKHITEKLFDSDTLSLKKGCKENLYQGNLKLNNEKVLKLVKKSNHDEINKYDWAFDFPGWIGALDFSKENVKDILVIGMEPHIRKLDKNGVNRTAQVTYGLRETDENKFCELGEHLGNRRLWNNLNSVFNNNEDYYSNEKYFNNQIDKDFFKRIYITDLSHFAVKGQASEANISGWNKIREENANKYISRTIEFIRPKYIVSQGQKVSNYIDKLLQNNENINQKWECKHYPNSNYSNFKYFEVNKNKIIHIILPHLASGNTNSFWLPKQKVIRDPQMEKIRENLKEFEILTQKLK